MAKKRANKKPTKPETPVKKKGRHIEAKYDRDRFIAANRRVKAAELYALGRSARSIATELGVDHKTISTDLKAIKAEWRETYTEEFEDYRRRELRRLEAIAEQAQRTYEKSLQDAVQVTESQGPDGATKSKTVKWQAGDVAALAVAVKASESIRKLLGLDAATKTENKTEHSGAVAAAMMTPEQLKQDILSRLGRPVLTSDKPTPATESEDNGEST